MSAQPDANSRAVPLPLFPTRPHGRQAVVCRYRCGDACAQEPPNLSSNEYFGDLVGRMVNRRGLFTLLAAAVLAPAGGVALPGCTPTRDNTGGPLGFRPVEPNTLDAVVVPEGYQQPS